MSAPKRSLIVYSPTRDRLLHHAPTLGAHFGLELLITDWRSGHFAPPFNTLVLTTDPRASDGARRMRVELVNLDAALALTQKAA